MRLLVILVAALVAACGSSDTGTTAPSGGGSTAVLRVPVGTSPVSGPADAWVTIVVFSDFQCPFCGSVQPTLASVIPSYGADVRMVFKNFPLTSIHPFARPAALGAECAHAQGRFWQFHDALFAQQGAVFGAADPLAAMAGVATQAGLDLTAWQACRTDAATDALVVADMALGARWGITGTPSFVVNGKLVVGSQPAATFKAAIDAALSAAKASGVPAAQYYDKVILGL